MKEPDDDARVPADHPVPEHWMEVNDVEVRDFGYSIRNPDDWVASGPLACDGRGRRFETWEEAEEWARAFYGARFVGRVPGTDELEVVRWAFLIRGPRGCK